jgi:hypothetical protein
VGAIADVVEKWGGVVLGHSGASGGRLHSPCARATGVVTAAEAFTRCMLRNRL